MYTGNRLSAGARRSIVEAHANGERTADLARQYEVSRWTIYRLLKRYEETGNVDMDFDHCGRKPKLSESQLAAVRAALTADPHMRMQELHARLGLPCTLRTLYSVAKKMGFERPERAPQETPKQPKEKIFPIWKGWENFWQKQIEKTIG